MRCKIWKPVACTHCLKSIKNVSFVAFDVNGFAKDLHGVCLRVGVGVKGVCTGCEGVLGVGVSLDVRLAWPCLMRHFRQF